MTTEQHLQDGIQPWPIEWWYWSGHGVGKSGKNYSFMLALFKIKPFGLGPVWFMHSLVSCIETGAFQPSVDFFLTGLDKGSFKDGQFLAKVGKRMRLEKKGLQTYVLQTPRMDLECVPTKAAMPVGGSGYIDLKSSDTWYYSYPRMELKGRLKLFASEDWDEITGQAWMDHQCSPVTFNNEHVWKWFSFQFTDGTDLMCFSYGKKKIATLATLSMPDGSVKATQKCSIEPGAEEWTSPVTGAAYPLEWKFKIPEWDLDFSARAKVKEQEMLFGLMNYWEGPLQIEGRKGQEEISGNGFMELVGYPKKRVAKMLQVQLREMFPSKAGK